jgi:hypothetical protein
MRITLVIKLAGDGDYGYEVIPLPDEGNTEQLVECRQLGSREFRGLDQIEELAMKLGLSPKRMWRVLNQVPKFAYIKAWLDDLMVGKIMNDPGFFAAKEIMSDIASKTIKVYLYNENCIMKGRQVPSRELERYDNPDDGGDWSRFEGTVEELEEMAKNFDARNSQYGCQIARSLREAIEWN